MRRSAPVPVPEYAVHPRCPALLAWLRGRQRDGLDDQRAACTLAEDALLIAADVGTVGGTLGLAVAELCIALQRCNTNTNTRGWVSIWG